MPFLLIKMPILVCPVELWRRKELLFIVASHDVRTVRFYGITSNENRLRSSSILTVHLSTTVDKTSLDRS